MPQIIVYVCMQVENRNSLYFENQINRMCMLLACQICFLTFIYYGIVNPNLSMSYPTSINPLYSLLRLFAYVGRTSVYTSNMALNQAVLLYSRVVLFVPRNNTPYKQPFWIQPSLLTIYPYPTVIPRFSIIFPYPLTQLLYRKLGPN